MDVRTAFSALGLAPSATPAEVQAAYRDLVKVWHPDRFTGDPRLQSKATEMLRTLNGAHETLQHHFSNPHVQPEDPAPDESAQSSDTPKSTDHAETVVSTSSAPLILWTAAGVFALAVILVAVGFRPTASTSPTKAEDKNSTYEASGFTDAELWRSFLGRNTHPPRYVTEAELDPLAGPVEGDTPWHATSISELAVRMEGVWRAGGKRFELRDGVLRRAGDSATVAFYEPISGGRQLLLREQSAPRGMKIEVTFTSSGMIWHSPDPRGQRSLLFSRPTL